MKKFVNASVFIDGRIIKKDFAIDQNGHITFKKLETFSDILDLKDLCVIPGLIDIHIHTRNPGYENKDELKNINNSLLSGGFTHALAMANVNPLPTSKRKIIKIQEMLKNNLASNVLQVGRITNEKGRTISSNWYWKYINFASDDGLPVTSEVEMKKALRKAKKYNVKLLLHEQNPEIKGVCYDSEFAKKFDLISFDYKYECDWVQRDIKLNKDINANIHIQHISTIESLMAIEKVKGTMNITSELTPHHLLLDNSMIQADDGNWKMNPPLPTVTTRKALSDAFKNENINVIATDHAPHTSKEKNNGFNNSLNGIIGLETAFGLINKYIIDNNLPFSHLVKYMSLNPGNFIGVDNLIYEGNLANLTIVNLNERWIVNRKNIKSKNCNTPFMGQELIGKVKKLIINGRLVNIDK